MVAKAEQRDIVTDKETIFSHGNTLIAPERISHFKKRKTLEGGPTPSPRRPPTESQADTVSLKQADYRVCIPATLASTETPENLCPDQEPNYSLKEYVPDLPPTEAIQCREIIKRPTVMSAPIDPNSDEFSTQY